MDEHEELLRRIQLGEDSSLELKQADVAGRRVAHPKRAEMSDCLAGFANSRGTGGTVVVGVDDKTRDIIGIRRESLDLLEQWLRQICNDSIKPPLLAQIRKLELPDADGVPRPMIRVDVPRSLLVHKSAGGYFHRIGSDTREIPVEQLARLLQERSQTRVIRFDESAVPRTTPADIDAELAARFFRGHRDPSAVALQKLRLVVTDEDRSERISVAGVLLAAREPQRWLPHAMIQAVAYRGVLTDVNYQLDARDIGGPLDAQVAEAMHFVQRNTRVSTSKDRARTERPQYSERAVLEAVVNAVAHRDYSMGGARIRLHLFADRLELLVPGALATTLTPDSLHLRQYNRNELVVSLLARCPAPSGIGSDRAFLMDRRGDGVPIILEDTRQLSGQSPSYTVIDDSELHLILPAALPNDDDEVPCEEA